MAAYAAIVSLSNTIHNIQNHPRLSSCLHKKQIKSILENVDFMLDYIENYTCQGVSKEAEDLESRIARVARAAEDVYESHIVDQILPRQTGETTSSFLLHLQKVIKTMDSIKKKIIKSEKKAGFKDKQPAYSVHTTASRYGTGKDTMVGFDEELIQLMDVLAGQQSSLQIVSIVGMGGSGKTTLARNVYENSLITQHFDVCAWATISQQYNVREVLVELLAFEGKISNIQSVDELGERLYKSLSGRRYLIVLDDMWSTEVWDSMKFFFPDNGCRSRVVITTRLSNVGDYCGCPSFRMNFLDEEKSWNLFCRKVFGQEECPSELVVIGKTIVKLCRGLPLSIAVTGGLLQKSRKTIGYWQDVAKNIHSILSSGEKEQSCNVLFLSYCHLPAHLKPCFLSMGAFREDVHIRVSQLIPLWIAMGFLKSNGNEILEEVGERYLNNLIDRNLILVGRRSPNGKIGTCQIHDLLRDLCLKVAEKERFFCVTRKLTIPRGIDGELGPTCRDLKLYNRVFDALLSASLSFCRFGKSEERLLSVLHLAHHCTLEDVVKYVNLRYIAYFPRTVSNHMIISSSIFLIWNLQTLIIKARSSSLIVAPLEIWKMPQLRHIGCSKIYLPDPPPSDQQDDLIILRNLLTLKRVVNFSLSEEACKRISNITKMHIIFDDTCQGYNDGLYSSLSNLAHLHKLESLNLEFSFPKFLHPIYFPEINLKFPRSLEKLSLTNSRLSWKYMTRIGSLPRLEVLKLGRNAIVGSEWSPVDGEFLRLRLLSISNCDLVHWNADSSHFPVLKKLVLEGLDILDEVPSGIGDIPTLELIHLHTCSESAEISSMKIKEEQESLGNDGLQIRVMYSRITSKLHPRFPEAGNLWRRCKRAGSF